MNLVNLKDASDKVSFAEAVKKGLGKNQGLYFPQEITPFENINDVLALPFVERSIRILKQLIGDELPDELLSKIVTTAFQFGAPLVKVTENIYSLE